MYNNNSNNSNNGNNSNGNLNNNIIDIGAEFTRLSDNRIRIMQNYEIFNPRFIENLQRRLQNLNEYLESNLPPSPPMYLSSPNRMQFHRFGQNSMPFNPLFDERHLPSFVPDFEMITTISTMSHNNLSNSFLDAINNIASQSQFGINQENVIVPLPDECKKKIPSKKYKNVSNTQEELCSICFETFSPESRCRNLPCKHIFHKRCIDKWFKENVKCPMCRQDIRELTAQIE